MPTAENLRHIKTFEQLVRYLEDELDWPLEQYGFDDLTFEYAPAEVGLRDEEAAKVRAIHQLRPVVDGLPWGIFFIRHYQKPKSTSIFIPFLPKKSVRKAMIAPKIM